MPSFPTMLKNEIARVSREEAKRLTLPLKRRIAALEKLVSELSRRGSTSPRPGAGARARTPSMEPDRPGLDPESIRDHRTRLGLTQRELARRLGVSHVAVYHWEMGRARPQARNRSALLKLMALAPPRQARQPKPTPRGPTTFQRAVAESLRKRLEATRGSQR